MAAPNIVSVSNITGKTAPLIVITSVQDILSNSANSGKVLKVNTFMVSNINGSASAPSYSFISDTNTGVYLKSSNQLGLSANGTEMVLINNSNPSAPVVSTPATFSATNYENVSGGTF